MQRGLLWLCSKENFKDDVLAAAKSFENKTGMKPNVAYIHPDDYKSLSKSLGGREDDALMVAMIEIKPLKGCLKQHLWIGVDNGTKS